MDPELLAQRRVGTTLCNKWTLEQLIGTGGMAAVYVASHKIGRREAIKILHQDIARDPELRARFEQEAHAVNRFKHPGTVEVRDIDVAEDGSPFMVMELLDGKPLADLARQPGGVALADLLRWVDELLDVLVAAHMQGIIHRDIKPDNLFVTRDGTLKVLDFGIARVRAGATPQLRTRAGATLGTAPYMPPEQIKGQEIDARADLFAVGATMFRLIARRRVHEGESEAEVLVKMASMQAPPLASVAPDVPREVALIVDRALMFDRDRRYPDALTMQGDIRAAREGKPPPYASALALTMGPQAAPNPAPPAAALLSTGPQSVVVVSNGAPLTGTEMTALAQAAPERTAAASPVAIQTSASAAVTPAIESADPTTKPAMAVQPSDGVSLVSSSSVPTLPTPPTGAQPQRAPVEAAPPPGPSPERTMRSAYGAEGGPVHVHGFAAPTAAIAPSPPSVATSGPRTQVAGAMPVPLPPGASVPVVPAPKRSRTLAGGDTNVLPLVLVGVLFAALGVGITLWFMLRSAPNPDTAATSPTTTSVAEPNDPSDIAPRGSPRPTARVPSTPPRSQPASQPQQPQQPPQNMPFPPFGGQQPPQTQPQQPPGAAPAPAPAPSPGRGHGKGKGK
jgi:serine/threonine-protein kinase